MNTLEKHLKNLDSSLFSKFEETKQEVNLLLGKYSANFPTYTDHSINHTLEVFQIASELLSNEEITNLNADETYILSMSCLLHDIGMCVPEEKIKEISESKEILDYKDSHPNLSTEEFLRDIHHQLSNKFILHEWEILKIPSIKYAKAIGIVAEGHRKVDLGNFDVYDPQYFPKSGKEFVCLPYLAGILRVADELDVTNSRIPRILEKYYMPNNEISVREWKKHMATSQRNYLTNRVIFEVSCSDQNIYAALQEQFEKIQNVINYCQKVIRSIPFIENKHYSLNLSRVEVKYIYIGFDPKGIKFSFDIENVVTAFIGEDLYHDKFTALREALQNSIDSCRYKSKVLKEEYSPLITVSVSQTTITVDDNGAGMDEFIVENFFGRLASSFYEQDKVKSKFEAIGQFGVGVFSYFLLSEFIDIETKTKNSHAIKFRFDKDPKSYFHFYDTVVRTQSGTTITMTLKKELEEKINITVIEKYIRQIFKHIEIPIEINDNFSKTLIENENFEIDSEKEIKDRLKLHNKKIIDSVKIVSSKIDDEDVEGTCGLIIGKKYLETFQFSTNNFDSELFRSINDHRSTSQVSICQKGVFVNNYGSSFLDLLIGDLNLKKKIKINIDRNQFSDENQIYSIINRFETNILDKIFSEIERKYKNNDERIIVTNNFVQNYCNYINNAGLFNEKYISLLTKSLYVKIYNSGEYEILNLISLKEKYKEFIIISEKENYEEIFKSLKKPIVFSANPRYFSRYQPLKEMLIKFLNYHSSILVNKDIGYDLCQNEINDSAYYENIMKVQYLWSRHYISISRSNSKRFLVSQFINKVEFDEHYLIDTLMINYNHFFFQFIIKHHVAIQNDASFKKIAKSCFEFIYDIYESDKKSIGAVKELNDILKPLNHISKLKKFTLSDL